MDKRKLGVFHLNGLLKRSRFLRDAAKIFFPHLKPVVKLMGFLFAGIIFTFDILLTIPLWILSRRRQALRLFLQGLDPIIVPKLFFFLLFFIYITVQGDWLIIVLLTEKTNISNCVGQFISIECRQ
jgi:hypothetical protein